MTRYTALSSTELLYCTILYCKLYCKTRLTALSCTQLLYCTIIYCQFYCKTRLTALSCSVLSYSIVMFFTVSCIVWLGKLVSPPWNFPVLHSQAFPCICSNSLHCTNLLLIISKKNCVFLLLLFCIKNISLLYLYCICIVFVFLILKPQSHAILFACSATAKYHDMLNSVREFMKLHEVIPAHWNKPGSPVFRFQKPCQNEWWIMWSPHGPWPRV